MPHNLKTLTKAGKRRLMKLFTHRQCPICRKFSIEIWGGVCTNCYCYFEEDTVRRLYVHLFGSKDPSFTINLFADWDDEDEMVKDKKFHKLILGARRLYRKRGKFQKGYFKCISGH